MAEDVGNLEETTIGLRKAGRNWWCCITASCLNLDDCLCAVPHVFAELGAAYEALLALLGRCRSLVSTVIVGCWWVTQGTSRPVQGGEHATSPAWPH
jgi:hypothetical protein